MDPDLEWTWKGGVVLIGILSMVTLMMTAGSCGQADGYRSRTQAEINHLEQRLDNHLSEHPR